MKQKSKERGITLIALIITVIVLIILAGVTINAVIGEHGIFGFAKKAKMETEKAQISEMLQMSILNIETKYQIERNKTIESYYKTKESFISNGEIDIKTYRIPNENGYVVNENIVTIKIELIKGTGMQYEYDIDILTGNITYKGEEEVKETSKTYNIIYELNGGKFESEFETEYTKGAEIELTNPVKENATFEGWYKDEKCEGDRIYQITENMSGDITLYAKWVEITSHKITYVLNGGQFETAPVTEYEIGTVLKFLNPQKSGAAFDGWYQNNEFTGNEIYSTQDMVGDITIYAKWIEETPADYFTYSNSNTKITGFSDKGTEAFKDGNKNDLVIPKTNGDTTITAIGTCAFCTDNENFYRKNISIQKLIIQDNITSLGGDSFYGCRELTELTLPISLKATSDDFAKTASLAKVRFTKGTGLGVDYISDEVMPWKPTADNKIELEMEEGIISIGNYMFFDMSGLQMDMGNFPTTITKIGEEAFYGCSGLTGNLKIPNITTLGYESFNGCSGLTGTLTIPNGIAITESVFANCSGLTGLTIGERVTVNYLGFSKCIGIKELTIQNGATLCEGSFHNCTGITKITIEDGTYIGESCFSRCVELKELIIGNETTLCDYCFNGCSELEKLTIGDGTTIGSSSFSNCTKIKELIIHSKTVVGESSFSGCSGIEKLTIEGGATIGDCGFSKCSGIKELTIPNGTVIGDSSFTGCSGIMKLTIEDGAKFGARPFWQFSGLTELTMPISLNIMDEVNGLLIRGVLGTSKSKINERNGRRSGLWF